MRILPTSALSALIALAILSTAHATPVATARIYRLNGDQPYFDDASQSVLLPAEENLLRGLTPVAVEGQIRSGMGNGGTYYEKQAKSPACLTDGAIPVHENTGDWNKQSDARWLISDNSTLTWTFDAPKSLASVRFWTQWPDGNRSDIAVSSIQVTTDGESWTTLPNSEFCSGRNTGNAVVKNTILPFLENSPHFRMVEFRDDSGLPLATGITGLRIVFPEQELGYTCHWEIEAQGLVFDGVNFTLDTSVQYVDATLSGNVLSCGDGASTDVFFAYAPHGQTLPAVTAVATGLAAGATYSIPLTGLRIGTDYDYRVVVRNDLGEQVEKAGTFSTLQEGSSSAANPAGLWEVHLVNGNGKDWGTDAWAIPEGTAETLRHRELGVEMAYVTKEHPSAINGVTYYWSNNSTYAYVGYMYLQGGLTYLFESSIDDTAYLKIGDTVVKNCQTYTGDHRSTWECPGTGWYPVDIRVGDFTGNSGPIGGKVGYRFSTDNGTTWSVLRDPGDGSLFRTTVLPKMTLASSERTATAVRLVADFVDGGDAVSPAQFAGASLYACYGATYGGETVSAWTSAALPAVAQGETRRTASVDVPAGAQYLRFRAVIDGVSYWSNTLILSDLSVVDGAAPFIAVDAIGEPSGDALSFAVNVASVGDDADTCDLTVLYGTDPAALSGRRVYTGVGAGSVDVQLVGLAPATTYYVSAQAANAAASGSPTTPFAVTTADSTVAASDVGLWEVHLQTNKADWTTDVWGLPTSTAETDRHRELGVEMAYLGGSRTSTINNQTYKWNNKSTFAYVGYMYLEGGCSYLFESSIDDTAFLKIGDTVVKDCPTYTEKHRSTWECPETGWYPVDIRVGDDGGNAGPIGNNVGYRFTVDGGSSWSRLLDPGDGSLFRTTLRSFRILSAVNTGSSLRLEVAIGHEDDEAHGVSYEGATIDAFYGAAYGAETPASWTGTAALADVAEGETLRTCSVAISEGTRFFRLRLRLGDVDLWSNTLDLLDYEVTDPATPSISLISCGPAGVDSTPVAINVLSTGDGFDACDITIAYGTNPDNLSRTQTFAGKEFGANVLVLTGLLPNRVYYATATASNASATSAPTAVFSFQTQPASADDRASGNLNVSWPGLWQGAFTGDTDGYTDTGDKYALANADAGSVHRELGAVMAYINNKSSPNGYTSALDGTEYNSRWTGDTTYAYTGWIWLDAAEYVFGAYLWDYVYLKIDDDLLMNQVITWGIPVRARTYATPGWHRFELRGSNKGDNYGGAGDEYEKGKTIAISYSTNATMVATVKQRIGGSDPGINSGTIPFEGWSQFVDPGDGSFLRTAAPLRSIVVDSFSVAGGTLAANLSFGDEMTGDYQLYIATGTTDAGDNPENWTATNLVATIPSTDGSYAYTGLNGVAGTDVTVARFYFTDGVDIRWGDTLYLPDPADLSLSAEVALDAHLGDTLGVSGFLSSAGAAASASVTVLVSESADMADAVAWPVGSVASGDAYSALLHEADTLSARYIRPGTTYYVSVVAEDGVGGRDALPPVSVAMPACAELADALSATSSMWTADFSGSLDVFGAGDTTTVELWTGTSANDLALTASTVMRGPGTVSFPGVEFSSLGTVYYQLRAANACATDSWTDATPVASVTLSDSTTYTWRNSVTSGDWSDPACWDNSLGDSRLTFPNSPNCTVKFTSCQTGTPIRVHLDGDYSVNTMDVKLANLDLVLAGDGQEDSRLNVVVDSGSAFALAAGGHVTLDAAYMRVYNISFADDAKVRVQNGAYLYSFRECVLGSRDDAIEIADDSEFHIQEFLLRMNGTRPTLRIDDGTFSINGTFAPNSNSQATGTLVELSGTDPVITAGGICPSEQTGTPVEGAEEPVFRFVVPAEGYAAGPRVTVNNNPFPQNERIPIRVEIARESGWFQGGRTASFKLVQAKRILTDFVDLDNQPRPDCVRFYYTYGSNDSLESDGNAPTGLWVEVKPLGATVLLFR